MVEEREEGGREERGGRRGRRREERKEEGRGRREGGREGGRVEDRRREEEEGVVRISETQPPCRAHTHLSRHEPTQPQREGERGKQDRHNRRVDEDAGRGEEGRGGEGRGDAMKTTLRGKIMERFLKQRAAVSTGKPLNSLSLEKLSVLPKPPPQQHVVAVNPHKESTKEPSDDPTEREKVR